jgi:hypothetical protein
MNIMVFTEGTLFIHSEWLNLSREQMVEKVKIGDVPSYESLVPIGNAPGKLRAWVQHGARIIYLTSRRELDEIVHVRSALERFGLPTGELHYRQENETYQDVAARSRPDVIVEDDCASIGGEAEMTYSLLSQEIQVCIRSVVVPEFGGIDHLPDSLSNGFPDPVVPTK